EALWYVHREGELLRFQSKQNLYRRIAETAQNQSPHQVEERMRDALKQAIGQSPPFKVRDWAAADGSIPDEPEPTVTILASLPQYRITDDGGKPAAGDQAAVEELWNRVGRGLRRWRNALVIVAPDRE